MGGMKEVFRAYLGPGPEKRVKDLEIVNLEKRRFRGRLAFRRRPHSYRCCCKGQSRDLQADVGGKQVFVL